MRANLQKLGKMKEIHGIRNMPSLRQSTPKLNFSWNFSWKLNFSWNFSHYPPPPAARAFAGDPSLRVASAQLWPSVTLVPYYISFISAPAAVPGRGAEYRESYSLLPWPLCCATIRSVSASDRRGLPSPNCHWRSHGLTSGSCTLPLPRPGGGLRWVRGSQYCHPWRLRQRMLHQVTKRKWPRFKLSIPPGGMAVAAANSRSAGESLAAEGSRYRD